jgi:hypothetical protein
MNSNGSAHEAPRGTRAKELNNAETGGRNDIMTIILAYGTSYDSEEQVVHRGSPLEMRVAAQTDIPLSNASFADRNENQFWFDSRNQVKVPITMQQRHAAKNGMSGYQTVIRGTRSDARPSTSCV